MLHKLCQAGVFRLGLGILTDLPMVWVKQNDLAPHLLIIRELHVAHDPRGVLPESVGWALLAGQLNPLHIPWQPSNPSLHHVLPAEAVQLVPIYSNPNRLPYPEAKP